MTNVLIYPCGADNAIELYNSIKHSLHLKVYGANSKSSIADLIFDKPIVQLPNISEPDFLDKLNLLINDYDIDYIFPTHDDVVYFLSKECQNIKCKIIGGDPLTNKITRYKKATYDKFRGMDFCPEIYTHGNKVRNFPVFVKPDQGHGSVGAKIVDNDADLQEIDFEEFVVSEYLPGKEFTVDCFTDKDRNLQYAFARERFSVRNGVSHINTEADESVQEQVWKIGERINKILLFNGLWFFQVKEDHLGNLKLLEICPRIATTMAFSRYKGINLPLLSIFSNLGYETRALIVNKGIELYRYSGTKVKYNFKYTRVYLDFDDTLIVNGKVCLSAVAFIYQCVNNKIDVYLISKHKYDIYETLNSYKISDSLFKEIIIIPMNESKYKYISGKDSIFIDNYYFERDEVFKNNNIPVFDVDLIDTLIIN